YYVSTTGSDSNPGTITQPFRTLNHAVAVLHPGDTLYVRGGTYAEGLNNDIPGGTAAAPVTIAGYSGETAIIEPSSGDIAVQIYSQSYIVLQNLVIDGTHLSSGGADVKITYSSSSTYASH